MNNPEVFMFRRALILAASLMVGLPSSALAAPCVSPGDPAAKRLDMGNMEAAAPVFVHLGLWLGIFSKRSLNDDLRRMRDGCERAEFNAGALTYVLRGDDDKGGLARVAMSSSQTAPIGYLTPVPDLATAMTSGHAGSAPISGYALVTTSQGAHTTWRIYDRVPGDAMLLTDFTQALSGQIKPLMRWREGQIEIVTP